MIVLYDIKSFHNRFYSSYSRQDISKSKCINKNTAILVLETLETTPILLFVKVLFYFMGGLPTCIMWTTCVLDAHMDWQKN